VFNACLGHFLSGSSLPFLAVVVDRSGPRFIAVSRASHFFYGVIPSAERSEESRACPELAEGDPYSGAKLWLIAGHDLLGWCLLPQTPTMWDGNCFEDLT